MIIIPETRRAHLILISMFLINTISISDDIRVVSILAIMFIPFWFYCSETFKCFGFPISGFWAYPM